MSGSGPRRQGTCYRDRDHDGHEWTGGLPASFRLRLLCTAIRVVPPRSSFRSSWILSFQPASQVSSIVWNPTIKRFAETLLIQSPPRPTGKESSSPNLNLSAHKPPAKTALVGSQISCDSKRQSTQWAALLTCGSSCTSHDQLAGAPDKRLRLAAGNPTHCWG